VNSSRRVSDRVQHVHIAVELTRFSRPPGCGAAVPLITMRLPLLKEKHTALGLRPSGVEENAKKSNQNGAEPNQDDAAFLLKTTPRYWANQIRMLEISRQAEYKMPQINPYTVRDKIITRCGGPMIGWAGLPDGYAPASLQGLSTYELPVPRKPGSVSAISQQSSFGSTRASPRETRSTSKTLHAESSSWLVSTPRREDSYASVVGEWSRSTFAESWSTSRSEITLAQERKHMLDGHVIPGKHWRKNSTFKEMAKLRIALEVPELGDLSSKIGSETRSEQMRRQADGNGNGNTNKPPCLHRQKNSVKDFSRTDNYQSLGGQGFMDQSQDFKNTVSSDFHTRHQTESKRRMSMMQEVTDELTKDLRDLEAVEDLLEIRRDSDGGWYLPNGRCLHWSETQMRAERDQMNAEMLHEQEFGCNSKAYRWRRLSGKIVHHLVAKKLHSIMSENYMRLVILVQKGIIRWLRVKWAREARARQWAKEHDAAKKIQARARGIADRIYARFVSKCKTFLDSNANVFLAHKAFVRAKRAYTGTIEPPATATAFAFMGDADSASDKQDWTLTFVEFCHALNDHLYRAALDPMKARRTSIAIARTSSMASSGPSFARIGSSRSVGSEAGQVKRTPSGEVINTVKPSRTSSLNHVEVMNTVKPFVSSQDHILLMAESTARLIYLYDDTHLGLLSECDFWSACREIQLSTGVKVSREDGKFALRYTRGQGGIALNMLCALQEIASSSYLTVQKKRGKKSVDFHIEIS
jgi:hypothetical protein